MKLKMKTQDAGLSYVARSMTGPGYDTELSCDGGMNPNLVSRCVEHELYPVNLIRCLILDNPPSPSPS